MLQEIPGGGDGSVVEAARLVIDSLGAQIHAPEEPPGGETPNPG